MRRNAVPRPRLLDRLDEGLRLGQRLTLLSAPAGCGKTTLLSEWITGPDCATHGTHGDAFTVPGGLESRWFGDGQEGPAQHRVAWLSLDEQDNEPRRFWTYVITALRTIEPGLGQTCLNMLQVPQQPSASGLLTPLLNEISALPLSSTSPGVLLVLDDYHLVANHDIHEGMRFIMEHQTPGLHLVISTRADPPLPVFRLRARNQLTELRSDDLRFSPHEAGLFLTVSMGLNLAAKEVQALEVRTEGWIVGLQLAALSLQGRDDAEAFIAGFTGSHHYVLEYLTQEIVRCQPVGVRQFLLQTSVLERLCGPLCDALMKTGEQLANEGREERGAEILAADGDSLPWAQSFSSSTEILAYLHSHNLFVVPLDDGQYWYRYHHLFADLLSNLLRQQLPVEGIRGLHRCASVWYEQNDFPDDAIRHALEAQDYARAALLIEGAAQVCLSQGRLVTLLNWLEALPETALHARPQLRLYQAWALHLSGCSKAAEQMLRQVQETVMTRPPSAEARVLRGKIAALLAGIAALRGGTAETIDQARVALSHLSGDDLDSIARVYIALGTAHAYEDDLGEAEQAWRRASALALEAGNPFLAAAALELLAGMQIYHQGRLRDGLQVLQQILDLGTGPGGSKLPFAATAHALLADVYLEWNDLDAARIYLEEGLELQRRGGIAYGLTHTHCAKARLARAEGDRTAVFDALQTAEQALAALPMWHIVLHLAACQTRSTLWAGDVEAAARWAAVDVACIADKLPHRLPRYLREVQQLSMARVHLVQGEIQKTLDLLDSVLRCAETAGRSAHLIETYLLRALALRARGQTGQAMESLALSLSLAEPQGYLRLYLEVGEPLPAMLLDLQTRVHAYDPGLKTHEPRRLLICVDGLLAALADSAAETGPSILEGNLARTQSLAEPLTRREGEVLGLIAKGYTNLEIAEALVVTLNTVKKHASGIYGKLGVHSRTQAVARARELGLL